MNHTVLGQIGRLRALLQEMERDIGLNSLTRNERDVFLAFCACIKDTKSNDDTCTTETVRANPIVVEISQPTFHRTLRQLIERGLLERCEGAPTGRYRLTQRALDQTT